VRATGWFAGSRIQARSSDFSLLHSVQADFVAHHASYSISIRDTFPGVKRPQPEADHSSASGVEVKNSGAMPPLSHTSSWGGA
jgi:hypothetical protein